MNRLHYGTMVIGVLFLSCRCWAAPGISEVQSSAQARLRGSIVDASTGLATPCTVAITDATGVKVIERESFKDGFRCEGRFLKRLPAGKTRVRVWRGFETIAEERVMELSAGVETSLEIRLRRQVDLRKRGWYAGDSHAHMLHGEKTIPVDFDFVALAAQAEDLQHLSLAQTWEMENPTPENLSAELDRRSTPASFLTWNLEAPKNYYLGDAGRCLGHCWTLGLRGRTDTGEDVIRLLLQASAHDYETTKPSFANFESHQLIHAQGGVASYSHPLRWWTGAWGGQAGYPKREAMRVSNMAVELPLDVLIGPTFDGLDVITGAGEYQADALAFELWSLLLNHGYRLAATASSDACFDRPGGATPGMARTYSYVEGEFSIPAAARALAQGRTVATTGPLLWVAVDGHPPGSAVAADGAPQALSIEAWASGTDAKGLTRLEVLRNGKPFQTHLFSPALAQFKTNLALRDSENAWYCVRAFGGDPQRQRAVSGAFYFETQKWQPPAPVPARVKAALVDAATGAKLSGILTEIACQGPILKTGRSHAIADGTSIIVIPGTMRLRADVPGYQPLTLSPFFDYPELREAVTGFQAEDLVKWETYERIRQWLGQVPLTFKLQKKSS